MKPSFRRRLTLCLLGSLACASQSALAQTGSGLYDPQPPADSAYVRWLVLSAPGAVDVKVDGKARSGLAGASTIGDYMVLPATRHSFTLSSGGSSVEHVLEPASGRALTVVLPSLAADAKPQVFEDRGNSNKLKALITLYHLDGRAGAIDVSTADGSTKVFSNVAPGKSASLSVNPLSVELIATRMGDKNALSRALLVMSAGATYSLFVLPADGGKTVMKAGANALERYTGK